MSRVQTATRVSKGIWPLLRRLVSFNFFGLILLAIFVYAIVLSVQQQSIEPLVTGIGGKTFASLVSINEDSIRVLDEGYPSLAKWDKTKILFSLLGSFMFAFVLIRMISKIVGYSIGDLSRPFTNYGFAVILFVALQMIFSLWAGSSGYLGDDYQPIEALTLPWDASVNFFNAVPVILKPVVNIAEIFEGNDNIELNSTNQT